MNEIIGYWPWEFLKWMEEVGGWAVWVMSQPLTLPVSAGSPHSVIRVDPNGVQLFPVPAASC